MKIGTISKGIRTINKEVGVINEDRKHKELKELKL
jgi:hypothetical protein